MTSPAPSSENTWYKDAIIYEMHVKSFSDSDGDGIGDFKGLTSKLDYLQDLGVTALWLLPFYPSPQRDDGYDIQDYNDIHPMYGTLSDFRIFLKEAHKRSLKVITELVINHTSDQHPWFQRARKAPAGSKYRDYYVWSDTVHRYQDARIIFRDFEHSNWTWDATAKSHYWHRFYSHQPDLNFENPDVQKEVFKTMDFWLDMGVDGLRLDAVPYLYEQDGTNCENLPQTHEYLKKLRSHVDRHYPGRMLLAEANQWPEDAVAYFGEGDECHMAFHFPIMPRMFMAIRTEDGFPITDILAQTPAIADTCQWALFLRNHDELTLEMVTDEERDYMYRAYAHDPEARINLGIRRRLAPLLGNNRRKIELMNGLLFSLPGTPIIYYGDELGMGDNIYLGDRNGVRTPMQWCSDRNAGFSNANPQRLFLPVGIDPEYNYETVNASTQENNPHSLLWWTKRLIAIRKRFKSFGRGDIKFLNPDNPKILAYVRRLDEERVMVIANLSRFTQFVQLNLSEYKGMTPVEIFGKTKFPKIGELPYFITLGPHSFYWFSLVPDLSANKERVDDPSKLPMIQLPKRSHDLLSGNNEETLIRLLHDYLPRCRWFAGKNRTVSQIVITEAIRLVKDSMRVWWFFVEVRYIEGEPETYILPLGFMETHRFDELTYKSHQSILARMTLHMDDQAREGYLCDAFFDAEFCRWLLQSIAKQRDFKMTKGEIVAEALQPLKVWMASNGSPSDVQLIRAEQSNTSIVFGKRMVLKMYRKLQEGRNPDLEANLFLNNHTGFRNIPKIGGYIEYRMSKRMNYSLGILQEWIENEGDAWSYTMNQIAMFYERILSAKDRPEPTLRDVRWVDLCEAPVDPLADSVLGDFVESLELMARRTAEMHMALASDPSHPSFAPERMGSMSQRSLYQSIRNLIIRTLNNLKPLGGTVPDKLKTDVADLLHSENQIYDQISFLVKKKVHAALIRCHGDFHLGQVLFTGKDFVILDFEGEPIRSIVERKIKRSPLRDVAGMIRSFHYAAFAGLWSAAERRLRPEDVAPLELWAKYWYECASVIYLKTYLEMMKPSGLLPEDKDTLENMLRAHILEKAVYEIDYELKHRPNWLHVPVQGILQLVRQPVAM